MTDVFGIFYPSVEANGRKLEIVVDYVLFELYHEQDRQLSQPCKGLRLPNIFWMLEWLVNYDVR